ncbi:DHA2 family efflux MFS transporter permease subunit [Macrococcus hajekii]|uniref:DHA2 family efflux MFS transporter permease subunit n=1 Tax=Macrococcus hajekii TaxID=198482 RepID=A0A4R6BLX1_9STAP|nr:MDR family MFS transporter [Macrococcus hajekii]TDM02632.1 DHA2 family efflux MFS transporter permease subunit [Macrococcus hajekii]GGB02630.1 multidrug MFS transporter [Macrococcus hajekii]
MKKSNIIMYIFMTGAFFTFLNETLLNIALTELMHYFKVDAPTVQWLATGFMLVMGMLMPLSASLVQWFSTRRMFMGLMTVFLIGTLIAGFAVNFQMLLLGRMIQAAGTGLLMPTIMTAMLLLFEPHERGKAMGNFGLVMMFAPAIGPTLSGIIVDLLGWRWLFFLVVPFVIGSILLAYRFLENVTEVTKPKIDLVSGILSSLGVASVIYGFSSVSTSEGAFLNPVVLATIILGAAALLAFGLRQRKLADPMLDLSVFKYPNYSRGMFIFVVVVMALFASNIVMPIYLQGPMAFSAKVVGMILLPGALLNGLLSPVMGRIFDRIGPRKMIIPGLTVLASVMLFYSFIHPGIPVYIFIAAYILLMVSISMIMMPSNTNALNQLPKKLYPHGTAISNMMQPIAGAMGVSIFISIMTHGQKKALEGISNPTASQLNEALTTGVHHSYWFATFLVISGLIMSFFITRSTAPKENTNV